MEIEGKKFSQRVAPNMAVNILRTVIMAVLGLVMVPYYIGELGISVYGILPLATSVTSYVVLISDSLSSAFSRFLIVALQEGDQTNTNRVYTSIFFGMGRMMLMMIPVILVISYIAPFVFNIGPSSVIDVQIMFLAVLSSSLVMSFCVCMSNVFVAYNNLYVLYTIRIIHSILQVVFVIGLFLIKGPSLMDLGFSFLLAALVYMVLLAIFVKRTDPNLRVKREYYSSDKLKEMGGLGAWTVINKLGGLLFIQASLILVNLYLGSKIEGGFALIVTMISMMHTVCWSLAATMVPILYFHYTHKDKEKLVKFIDISMRFMGLFMAFPTAYLCIFAPQILTIWVGPEFTYLHDTLFLMLTIDVAVSALSIIEPLPVVTNRIRPVAITTLLIGGVNIGLGVFMLTFTDLGILGVGIAWLIASIMLHIFLPLYDAHILSVSPKVTLKPIAISYVGFIICLLIGYGVTKVYTLPATWIAVIVSVGLTFIVYSLAMIKFGFRKAERAHVRDILPDGVAKHIPAWLL